MNLRPLYRYSALAILACGSFAAQAQPTMTDPATGGVYSEPVNTNWQPSLVRDGAYDKVPHARTPLPLHHMREADILWKKRVWREIDTREKQNLAFRYPGDDETGGGYFIEILIDAVKKGKLKAYSPLDDRFTSALTKEQIMEAFVGVSDTTMSEDPLTGEITQVISHRDFDPDRVTRYRVKEDWMFDRNLGRMTVRIIGIAPMIDRLNDDGSFRASSPMFWIYYPEARNVMAQYEVYNPENDLNRLSWTDYWEGRFWHGRIIQVSNPFKASFSNLGLTNMEALYEGQRTQEELINKELDMWEN